MSIRFSCSCGRKLKVSDEKIGMKVLCSSCGATLKVPKKSMDEYWQDVPVKSDQPKVDYIGGLKEFLVNFVPGALVIGLVCWFAYFLSNQILTGRGNYPPLGQVTGKVTLAGQPLGSATVRFAPKDPIYGEGQNGKRLAASVSIGVTDANGNYTLTYVKDMNGAYVGVHKVKIEAKDAFGRERLKPEFNSKSTIEREVKPGSQVMDFDVQSNEPTPTIATPAPQSEP
ncbi:MAG TPA: hypothetical protein VEI07_21785 [Planctomycetaceae bacterium]|nr:hypothetical protein [Planctomycetaceae bacterium]